MTTGRTWTEDSLRAAVAAASSWRGVMRELGLNPDNGGTTKTIRRQATKLGLDSTHFRRNRSWSDDQLRVALADARTWDDALRALGLSTGGGGSRSLLRAHAMRLGIDISHLGQPEQPAAAPAGYSLDPAHLRHAAESLAAAWFTGCGCGVAIPTVPCSYDLLVSAPDGIKRVQVKTTTCNTKVGWDVAVSRRPYSIKKDAPLIPYSPEDVDLFFIVDGDLSMYVIPMLAVAGRMRILLRAYKRYIVGNAAALWTPVARVV